MMYFLVFDSYIHICTNMLSYTRKEEPHQPTTGTDRRKEASKCQSVSVTEPLTA